jgi:hypothetical protein
MIKKNTHSALLACAALCVADLQAQDHGHLNIGAADQGFGSKLIFENGADFGGDYVKTLTFTNGGKFANLFQGNITLTALHATDAFGQPVPGAAAPGSFILGEIVSVQGPAAGAFQFWDTNSSTAPAVSISVGTTNASYRFDVSDAGLGAGEPEGDPFGHIHVRRFTVTKAGLYSIGFRAIDVSSNGPAGGPIHAPSDTVHILFQGDVNITKVVPDIDHVHVSFGAMAGYRWQVQAKDNFTDASWTNVGDPVAGDDRLAEVEEERPVGFSRVYQVLGTQIVP